MANLKSIAELAWRQLFPPGSDEAKIDREEFVASAKTEYAYQFWIKRNAEKAAGEGIDLPSYLLTTTELEVVNGAMDISQIKYMQGLVDDGWLQNVGGFDCKCLYIKSSINNSQLLCNDDSLPDDAKTYYAVGKKIIFPNGVHRTPLPITYANNGVDVDESIEVDDVIASLVRRGLLDIYAGKVGRQDKTINSNNEI